MTRKSPLLSSNVSIEQFTNIRIVLSISENEAKCLLIALNSFIDEFYNGYLNTSKVNIQVNELFAIFKHYTAPLME